MPGGKPNVAGMVNDPQFLGLSPADQRTALNKLTGDDAFNQLSDGDTMRFVSKMSGGMNLRAPIPKPQPPQMQPSNLGIALGSENQGIANPQQPAEQFALQNPEQQGKLAMAAGIGAAGSGAIEAIPAAAKALIPYAPQIVKGAKVARDVGATLAALKYLSKGDIWNFIKKSPGK